MDARLLFPLVAMVGRASAVIGGWLLTYAVHSTVLIAAAWLLASRSRIRWSAAARHAIWGVALVAGFVTAAMQLASPWAPAGGTLRLPGARRVVAAVRVLERETRGARAPGGELPAPGARRPPVEPSPMTPPAATRLVVVGVPWTTIAVSAWALVTLALVARHVAARRRLAHALAGRRSAEHSLAAGALRHIRSLAGIRRPVALSTSEALAAPAAISSDEIVLPARVLRELSLAEQEGVLAHELAHVVRRDTLWLRLAAWAGALAWFQPLNRLAVRQMQLSAEFAADAWAVGVTRAPLTLAQALARVAEWVAPGTGAHAAVAPGADGSPLVERVRRLTTLRREPEGAGRGAAAGTMLAAAALALALVPRVEAGPSVVKGVRQVQRFEVALAPPAAAGASPRARAHLIVETSLRVRRAPDRARPVDRGRGRG